MPSPGVRRRTMKAIIVICAAIAAFSFGSCAIEAISPVEQPKAVEWVEVGTRVAYGRYYTDGTVITEDGHEWGYTQDVIGGEAAYDGEPVAVVFTDNGTPDYIEDDVVGGLVKDYVTALDDLMEEYR